MTRLSEGFGLSENVGPRPAKHPAFITPNWVEVSQVGNIERVADENLDFGSAFTIFFLVNPGASGTQTVFHMQDQLSRDMALVEIVFPGGYVRCRLWGAGNLTYALRFDQSSSPGSITAGSDNHVAITSSSTFGGNHRIYVNGVQEHTSFGNPFGLDWDLTRHWSIFGKAQGGANPMPVGSSLSELWVSKFYADFNNPVIYSRVYPDNDDLTQMPNHGAAGNLQFPYQPLVWFGYPSLAANWDAGENQGSIGAFGSTIGSRTDR